MYFGFVESVVEALQTATTVTEKEINVVLKQNLVESVGQVTRYEPSRQQQYAFRAVFGLVSPPCNHRRPNGRKQG